MGGLLGCCCEPPLEKLFRFSPVSEVRVGLVSRELASDLGIPEAAFFGIVPVPRKP